MSESPKSNTADETADDINNFMPASAERLRFLSKAASMVSGSVASFVNQIPDTTLKQA